jgi:outer membrane protein OmpA-like peptidoglycan-associated protein
MPLRRRTGAIAVLAVALHSTAALPARADDPAARGFDVDFSRPALSAEGGLFVETAQRAVSGTRFAAVRFDYAEGLLALRVGSGDRQQLLRSRLGAHLMGAYATGPWELGVHLPLVLSQRTNFGVLKSQGVTGPLVDPVSSAALGDLRLVGKRTLLPEEAPLGLAALLDVRLPTGDKQAFASDGLSVQPGLVVTRALGRVRLDAQIGYLFRNPGQYAQLVVHDGLTYGLGASAPLGHPGQGWLGRTKVMAELLGGWPRGNDATTARYRAPLGLRGGFRTALRHDLAVEAGAGTGLGSAGYGRESWRVFGGVRWVPRPVERSPEPAQTASTPAAPPPPAPALPGPLLASAVSVDRDGDGIPDAQDLCPDQPGTADMDGCPDRDGDFIPDPQDKCPDEPGPAINDGCPVPAGPVVNIENGSLSLKDSIYFDTAKATLKPQSDRVLDAIATLLKDHPELKRVRVEGHTDNVGSAAYNKDLSQRRAASVVNALTHRGIAPGRLVPQGYGFDKPIADNKTALGRAKNRRVEFTILDETSM